MRRATLAREPPPAVADETQGDRRKAVKELSRLGWLYGPLNQLAPLARLLAIATFVRHSSERVHLLPVIASIAASLTLRPLSLLAKRLLPTTETLSSGAEDIPLAPNDEGGSVSTATLRARLLATHLMQLMTYGALLGLGGVDLAASGLDPALPGREQAGVLGAATAAVAFALWLAAQQLLGTQRRDNLTMASDTKDMSSSTEDELVLLMAPLQRLAFLAVRCLRLVLDTLADVTLFYVFVVDTVSGASAIAEVYSATTALRRQQGKHALAVTLAALCFGSQHLRFKGEWLLGVGLGAALVGLAGHSGDLRASFIAAALFAILRYLNRTHDVRRFHGA